MLDKNLFLYDLAVVAIFKNEGPYLKEWLDYHLLAGVDHFFLYNNESSDDYKKVLAPYVEKNLVTLTEWPGKLMQYPAYEDAIEKFRFECRYMAFIDLDKFIFPKTNRSVVEVVDEILSGAPNATGLGINWQCFGSNGQKKADYSKGVLERFTRRPPRNSGEKERLANAYIKTIENPRFIRYRITPRFSFYFYEKFSVNSNGEKLQTEYRGNQILFDKIVINHYFTKSEEEFFLKTDRGRADRDTPYSYREKLFKEYDRNDEFDDDILKYRAARAQTFSFESDEQKVNRVVSSLIRTLTQTSPEDSFIDKIETFLTCRAVAEKFNITIGDRSAEEFSLAWLYRTLIEPITYAEVQMFLKALPEILSRPFPICKQIFDLVQGNLLPSFCEHLKNPNDYKGIEDWKLRSNMLQMQKLLNLIK